MSHDLKEKKIGKKLYDYQKVGIEQLFEKLNKNPVRYNLLYQLPTGGGKTVIFSEIAKRYIDTTQKKVLILTHRIELCGQTSNMLKEFGVKNKIINSIVKELPDQHEYMCFVGMVETLNNRLQDKKIEVQNIGLVIIDEAHYNSFRKLFKYFNNSNILGVTATPLSSNIKLPMKDNYFELIVGESISALINKGYLAKATAYTYDVGLSGLKIGINGDYTVSSSEKLYTNYSMQEKLLYAYEEVSFNKKTLIFNNGISTSRHVYDLFKKKGYPIRHLDNTHSDEERKEILHWFKHTHNAIITSVSILTTGFDEPTVESIILNRATRSLTLYHQMIGRGSRVLPNKSEFTVIDLGNNALRFGPWDSYVDWQNIFQFQDAYYERMRSDEEIERQFIYTLPETLKTRFKKSKTLDFNVKEVYNQVISERLRPKITLERSLYQHLTMCLANSENLPDALSLSKLLEDDIEYRIRQYSYCICKSSSSYLKWLQEEYTRKLHQHLRKEFFDLSQVEV